MSDPSQLQSFESQSSAGVNWFSWLLGLVVLLVSSIGEVYRRRVDKHEENHVTRKELEEIVRQNREDAQNKHVENTVRLERIEDRVNALPSVATTIRVVKQSSTRRRRKK
jgi:hypothetical protein